MKHVTADALEKFEQLAHALLDFDDGITVTAYLALQKLGLCLGVDPNFWNRVNATNGRFYFKT